MKIRFLGPRDGDKGPITFRFHNKPYVMKAGEEYDVPRGFAQALIGGGSAEMVPTPVPVPKPTDSFSSVSRLEDESTEETSGEETMAEVDSGNTDAG
jgi:hypothetical protein